MYHEANIVDNYYYFVKFTMQTNTYYREINYQDLISIKGIEFYGDFLYVYRKRTAMICYPLLSPVFLLLASLNNFL